MHSNCSCCHYWDQDHSGHGHCRRYPPSVKLKDAIDGERSSPRTYWDEGCGEHLVDKTRTGEYMDAGSAVDPTVETKPEAPTSAGVATNG